MAGNVRAGFIQLDALTTAIPVVTWRDARADMTAEVFVVAGSQCGTGNHFLEHAGSVTHLSDKLMRKIGHSNISLPDMHARKRMKNEHIETMRNFVPGQTHLETRMSVHPLGCLWTTTNTVDGERVTLQSFFVN